MAELTGQVFSFIRPKASGRAIMAAATEFPTAAQMRQVIRNPCQRIYYSSDSGYGSIESSPTKLSALTPSREIGSPRRVIHYDGNGSSHDSIDQFDGGDEDDVSSTPTRQDKFSTFPRTPSLTRPPQPFFAVGDGSRSRRGSDASYSDRRRSQLGTRLSTPDRFVPGREPSTPNSDKFRTSKSPEDLTPGERLVRHERDAPDPFYTHTQHAPTPRSSSAARLRHWGWGSTGTTLGPFDQNGDIIRNERQVSIGAIWGIGGLAPSNTGAVDNGHGGLIQSGTNAPIFPTSFHADRPRDEEDQAKHEARLAMALKIDRAQRVLDFNQFSRSARDRSRGDPGTRLKQRKTYWNGTEWRKDTHNANKEIIKVKKVTRSLPTAPFKVLDAPNLRDDYYCSVLAYSQSCDTLAVALGNTLYSWTEQSSVQTLNKGPDDESWLTSIDFSSNAGNRAILAYGRSNGNLSLMSLYDSPLLYDVQWPRFQYTLPGPVACLSWRPTVALRRSFNPWSPATLVENEDLLVGDDMGNIYYLAVEWPSAEAIWNGIEDGDDASFVRRDWRGKINHIITINVHTQQICGLSWSPNGRTFASGGNDNLCCVYDVDSILPGDEQEERPDPLHRPSPPSSPQERHATVPSNSSGLTDADDRPGLLATGLLFASDEVMTNPTSLAAPASPTYIPPALGRSHDPRTWWHRQEDEEETRLPEITTEGESPGTPQHWQARSPGYGDGTLINDDFPPYTRWDYRFLGRRGQEASSESVLAATQELGHPVRTAWNRPRIRSDGCERHRWMHTAAVKAIAFCPWRDGLVATSGGSNDKCIHFYHTTSGAALATIAVHAQVTSLIWSVNRREIAATFGYANPEHPYRIAIFSWPECQQVAAIPWEGEHRALYAIPYPRGPALRGEESDTAARGSRMKTRNTTEGCIVVAASDESIKFHEVWNSDAKATVGGFGMLGGSDILEGLEGIDKDGDIIR